MTAPKDPRRHVGARVAAKATAVANLAECSRLFGAAAKEKVIEGTVQEVIVENVNNRNRTSLRVHWTLTTTPTLQQKTCTVKLASTKLTVDAAQICPSTNHILPQPSSDVPPVSPVPTPQQNPIQDIEQNSWDQASQEDITPITIDLPQLGDACAHGLDWYKEEVWNPIGGAAPRRFWSVRTAGGEVIREGGGIRGLTPFDCFMTMFPSTHLQDMQKLTTEKLLKEGTSGTTVSEILRFFGVLILMTRFEFSRKQDLWRTTRHNKYLPAPCFGDTGMSKNRFFDIMRCIRFSHQPSENVGMSSAKYRWTLVQDFVDAINNHRRNNFRPSELICVDESISRWYGLGGNWIEIGLPQYVAIDRKPESGCEIQDASCGRSGIMMRLELVTTAEDEAEKDYEDEDAHGTAVIRRLVGPWSGSARIVCADSYFASVKTAEALLRMGLKFIGVVKTATRQYPMKYLSGLQLSERGQHVTMVRRGLDGSPKMMALMWVDRARRYFISTTSGSMPGKPYCRTRWRQLEDGPQRVELTVPQPEVCEIYYSACAQIDRHNRCRQQVLNMEKKVRTQDWSFRVNTSLLSMCIVDAWLMYSGAQGERRQLNQRHFYEQLATELIDNFYDRPYLRLSGSDRGSDKGDSPNDRRISSGIGVHLTPTRAKRKTKEGVVTKYALQGACRVCKVKKTTHLCSSCLSDTGTVWVCHAVTGRDCFVRHLRLIHNVGSCDLEEMG